jgi:hypothetical protein
LKAVMVLVIEVAVSEAPNRQSTRKIGTRAAILRPRLAMNSAAWANQRATDTVPIDGSDTSIARYTFGHCRRLAFAQHLL